MLGVPGYSFFWFRGALLRCLVSPACAELVDADAEAAAERATTAGRRVTRSRSKKQ